MFLNPSLKRFSKWIEGRIWVGAVPFTVSFRPTFPHFPSPHTSITMFSGVQAQDRICLKLARLECLECLPACLADVAVGYLQFQIQSFDIVCSPVWTSRDRCCDIPSRVSKSYPGFICPPRRIPYDANGEEVALSSCSSRWEPRDVQRVCAFQLPLLRPGLMWPFMKARHAQDHIWKFSQQQPGRPCWANVFDKPSYCRPPTV